MSHATQELIDHLYTNMKALFNEPANSTDIYIYNIQTIQEMWEINGGGMGKNMV